MSTPQEIAVIVEAEELRQRVLKEFAVAPGVVLRPFASVSAFIAGGRTTAWSGIVIDFRTVIKPSPDKNAFLTLADVFPFMRLRVEADNTFSGVVNGENFGGAQLIENFFQKAVPAFKPRFLRKFERRNIVLNVVYSAGGKPAKKSITWNAGKGGMFLICPEVDKSVKNVDLVVAELVDKTPIKCRVAWSLAWGEKATKVPGYGLAIETIKDEQADELIRFLRLG